MTLKIANVSGKIIKLATLLEFGECLICRCKWNLMVAWDVICMHSPDVHTRKHVASVHGNHHSYMRWPVPAVAKGADPNSFHCSFPAAHVCTLQCYAGCLDSPVPLLLPAHFYEQVISSCTFYYVLPERQTSRVFVVLTSFSIKHRSTTTGLTRSSRN